jgi:hypothetical protein
VLQVNARNRHAQSPFINRRKQYRGEFYEDVSDFRFGLGYSYCNGTARRAFRIYSMEEALMLFFMLPAVIFFGMWSVLLEPPSEISLRPQRLRKPSEQ